MKMLIKRSDKRGNAIGIIIFFLVLFTIIIVGFIAAIVVSLIDYAGDEITPIFQDLGVAGSSNFSEYSEFTVVQVNRVIQALPWMVGVGYVIMLIFSVIFAMSYSFSPHPVYIAFYIVMILFLIMGSIILSNMYEDIYDGTDVIATRLQEQTMLSFMILYSPMIMALISFITGIFLFTRNEGVGGI